MTVNNENQGIIQEIIKLLPEAPFPVLEFVYWYLMS